MSTDDTVATGKIGPLFNALNAVKAGRKAYTRGDTDAAEKHFAKFRSLSGIEATTIDEGLRLLEEEILLATVEILDFPPARSLLKKYVTEFPSGDAWALLGKSYYTGIFPGHKRKSLHAFSQAAEIGTIFGESIAPYFADLLIGKTERGRPLGRLSGKAIEVLEILPADDPTALALRARARLQQGKVIAAQILVQHLIQTMNNWDRWQTESARRHFVADQLVKLHEEGWCEWNIPECLEDTMEWFLPGAKENNAEDMGALAKIYATLGLHGDASKTARKGYIEKAVSLYRSLGASLRVYELRVKAKLNGL